jgi:hypothetical protein
MKLSNKSLCPDIAAVFLCAATSIGALAAEKPDFAPALGSPLSVPGGGHAFVIGDVNADAKPDLLVCGGTSLTVMLGDGRGRFTPTASGPSALAHGAGEMVVGDFNHDGKLDWAGAHHDHYDVVVMLGRGDGRFTAAPGSPFVSRAPGKKPHTHGLVAGDMNGDGILDLVTANNEDDDVSVLLGNGRGGFAPAPKSPFPVGRSPYPLALVDVNGDGQLDVVAPNTPPGTRTLTMLFGDGRGALSPAPRSPFRTAGNPYYVAAGDLDGDRKPDLIATHNGDSQVTILLQRDEGRFEPAGVSPLELGARAWGIVALDLNRDGHVDLAAARQDAVAVFFGDGRGGFKPAIGSPFPSGRGTWRLGVADFDGDGKLDIAAGNVESDDISVLLMK